MHLILLTYDLGGYSGASKQAKLLSESLTKYVDTVSIINFYHMGAPAEEYSDNIKILNVRRYDFLSYLSFFRYLNSIRSNKDTVIHNQGFFLDAVFLQYLARCKFSLKLTMYGSDDLYSLRNGRFGWLKLYLAKRAVKINCLTNQMFDASKSHVDASKLYIVPNAVDLKKRSEINVANKEDLVIFVGVVCKRKGTDKAIDFFNANFNENFKMKVIGPTGKLTEIDNGYVDKCRSKSNSRVELTGPISKDDVLDYMRRAKFLILFSENEGMPNVVLESMSNNCIPIISEMSGLAYEIIPSALQNTCIIRTESLHKNLNINIAHCDEVIESQVLPEFVNDRFHPNLVAKLNVDNIFKV